MIPLKDNIPTDRFPVVTVALIAINVLFFIWQSTYSTSPELSALDLGKIDQSSLEFGAIPYRITHPDETADCSIGAVNARNEAGVICPGASGYEQAVERGQQNPGLTPIPLEQAVWYVTLMTSMFMHGGILHIVGNMLFLWVFGNNIEESMGRLKFALFYLAAGIVAVYSQAALGNAGPTRTPTACCASIFRRERPSRRTRRRPWTWNRRCRRSGQAAPSPACWAPTRCCTPRPGC